MNIKRLLAFGLITTTLGIMFADLVVPPIIEAAYRGESFSFLNRMIRGQAELPVAFYLQLWNSLALRVLVSYFGFWLLAVVMSSEAFFRRCVGNATPGTLGAIRMWTCAILLAITLVDDLGSIGLLPAEYRADMGLLTILHKLPIGFNAFLTNPSGLSWFQRLTEVLLLLGVVGWRTSIIIPLCALCTFVMDGILREYSGFWHQDLVPIYLLIVLSFTPCGDGWSIDRLRRIYRGQPVPGSEEASALYGWARYACWVPIALVYSSAGFSKLRSGGLAWMSATNMRGLLYEQTLYPRAGNFSISLHLAPAPDWVFVLLAVGAVCSEVFFITVLVSRTARKILPAVGILMHTGIIFLQNIVFADLMLVLLTFYDFGKVRDAASRWMRRAGPIHILYDGMCPLCRRTVRVLAAMDLFGRLELTNFRGLALEEGRPGHAPGLTSAELEKEMFVIARGKSHRGFEAYRLLALALPPLWPVAPWLYVPGVPALGRVAYGWVADHRLGLAATCDPTCSTDYANVEDPVMSTGWRRRPYMAYIAPALAAVIAFQLFFWLNKIEYYPFTSVQMFAGKPGTVVTYYKTLGHWQSGRVSPFHFEDTIPVMSINSRYEGLFDICFGPADEIALCKKTLAILGSAYNRKARASDKLTGLEIQRWMWDFGSRPRDPNYGDLDARFVGEVQTDGRDQVRLGADHR